MKSVLASTDVWSWVAGEARRRELDESVEALVAEFQDLPEERSRLLEEAGEVYWKFGLRAAALGYDDRAIAALRGRDSEGRLARLLVWRGTRGLQETNDVLRSRPFLLDGLQLLEARSGPVDLRATALHGLALAARMEGDPAGARRFLVRATELLDSAPGGWESCGSGLINNIAMEFLNAGESERARTCFQRLLASWPKSLGRFSWKLQLAEIARRSGNASSSEQLYREALKDAERSLPSQSPKTAMLKGNLGSLLFVARHHQEAEPLLREAAEVLDRSGISPMLAGRYACNLSVLLQGRKAFEESASYSRMAIRLRSDKQGRPTKLAAHCLLTLARAEMGLKRYSKALKPARQSVALNEAAGVPVGVAYGRRDLGRIHLALRDWTRALDAWEPAMAFFKAARGPIGRGTYKFLLEHRAECNEQLGRHAQAARGFEQASVLALELSPKQPGPAIKLLIQAAQAWRTSGSAAEARRCLERAVDVGPEGRADVRQAQELLKQLSTRPIDH